MWKARCKTTAKRVQNGMSTTCMNKSKRKIGYLSCVFIHFFFSFISVVSVAFVRTPMQKYAWSTLSHLHAFTSTYNTKTNKFWLLHLCYGMVSQQKTSQPLGSDSLVKWISVQTVCYDTYRINSLVFACIRIQFEICGLACSWFQIQSITFRHYRFGKFYNNLHTIHKTRIVYDFFS